MSPNTVRLSQPAKDQLVKVKRTTGIVNWNVLCRWALALSLQDPTTPLVREVNTDSNVEMTWKVFGGKHSDLYLALLKARCAGDGLPDTEEALSQVLTVHLHRGIGYLAGRDDLATISGLVGLAMAQQPAPTG